MEMEDVMIANSRRKIATSSLRRKPVERRCCEVNVKYAMSNTFGFGGHIASSIFKKVEEKP
jgi:3-oxoacyl-(acyl-carrier-protein) synthase